MYEPPVFLIFAALASSLAFGAAFNGVLGPFFRSEARDPAPLLAPYLGLTFSTGILIGGGLQILGIYGTTGFVIGLLFVALLAGFVWFNLLREYT